MKFLESHELLQAFIKKYAISIVKKEMVNCKITFVILWH
jgi:hypothetical protein